MPDRRYEVRVTGRLSQRARDAFVGMDVSEVTAETVISGLVHRDDQLHELLATVQSLGLHVVSVQQVAPRPRARVPTPWVSPSRPRPGSVAAMTAQPLTENPGTSRRPALESWRPGPARQTILDFVARTCGAGEHEAVPPEQRVAVFDNDGTLWCEKPMPIQLDFILRRLVEMIGTDPALADRQPWKAALEKDAVWLNSVITDHYAGDDGKVKVLLGGILAAYAGMSVEEFERRSDGFLRSSSNAALQRGYLQTAYRPMVELLHLLEANGFTNYIASGGGRDFMRPISAELYGVPRERVIGSSTTLAWAGNGSGGTITHTPAPEYLDDGPEKPIRIWSRVGRRPLLAAGNSDGDGPMLDFTVQTGQPSLRLLVLHDDADREFAYTSGAEKSLARADRDGLTVVSMCNDWATVF